MRKLILSFIFVLSAFVNMYALNNSGAENNESKIKSSSGYASVNGLKMYYEIHGEGKPLVLLHGSYLTIDLNYGEMIPVLAKKHKVIALELQGHGRTADIDRPFTYDYLADDVASLLKELKIDNADFLGYSMGGTLGLKMGVKYPEMVNSLIVLSSVYKYEGWSAQAREIFPTMKAEYLEGTPLKEAYDKLAPNPAHWENFVAKLVKFNATSYDLGKEKIAGIKAPVLLIMGDNDGADLNHVVEMYSLLGGGVFGDIHGFPQSQLAILPSTSHQSLMMETNKIIEIIDPFLNK